MTLYVRTGRRSTSSGWNYGEASRVDRLRADGWEECGTCGGYGYALPDEEPDRGWSGRCPDCVDGLVPPDGMVEAAAKAIHDNDRGTRPTKDERWDQLGEIQEFYHLLARAALVAAARWEAPGE